MTDLELKDLVASLAVESKKTDEQLKKTDLKLDRIAKMLGAIGNNQGDVAEEYFVNSLKDKLTIGDMEFDYLIPNYIIRGKNIKDEFDILLVNGESVAIIEVKYKVHLNDLEKLGQKIKSLKSLPQYRDYKVYAGIAGFKIPETVLSTAREKGYFVLQRKGNVIQSYTDGVKAA